MTVNFLEEPIIQDYVVNSRSQKRRETLLMLVVLCLQLGLAVQFITAGLENWRYRGAIDLPTFYWADQAVAQSKSPYHHATLLDLAPVQVFPFFYPPPSLLLFVVFRPFSFAQVAAWVYWGNHLLYFLFLLLLQRLLLGLSPRKNPWLWLMSGAYGLWFASARITIDHGQINIFWALAILLFWVFARRDSTVLAGFSLALALILKSHLFLLLIFLLLIHRNREVYWCLFFFCGLSLASLIVFPANLWHSWLQEVVGTMGFGQPFTAMVHPAAIWNQSINGFTARLFLDTPWSNLVIVSPFLARWVPIIGGFCLFVISLWFSRLYVPANETDRLDRTMCLVLPLVYLVSPLSWVHHLVYLLPVILLSFRSTFSTTQGAIAQQAGIILPTAAIALILGWDGGTPLCFIGVLGLWLLARVRP